VSAPLSEAKIVLVSRRTRLDELVGRFNTVDQARFYVEHMGADFSDYLEEDRTYKEALASAQSTLSRLGRLQRLDRSFLPNFLFGPKDLVVVLGQDGLVANVLKYLEGQPAIGVNPDPKRWEGVLLPFGLRDLPRILPAVAAGSFAVREVTLAEAQLNTGQRLLAVNDLFVGPRSHTSARYTIRFEQRQEIHSSSGLIVSTGLGSTGWFRSILAGAGGMAAAMFGQETIPASLLGPFPWDADHLVFCVREPWPSKTTSAELTCGVLTHNQPLELSSLMADGGVIFSDGIEADFLHFNSGSTARIGLAAKKGRLVV
jgi:hypothetical protein